LAVLCTSDSSVSSSSLPRNLQQRSNNHTKQQQQQHQKLTALLPHMSMCWMTQGGGCRLA
jgi:hypothetical protein